MTSERGFGLGLSIAAAAIVAVGCSSSTPGDVASTADVTSSSDTATGASGEVRAVWSSFDFDGELLTVETDGDGGLLALVDDGGDMQLMRSPDGREWTVAETDGSKDLQLLDGPLLLDRSGSDAQVSVDLGQTWWDTDIAVSDSLSVRGTASNGAVVLLSWDVDTDEEQIHAVTASRSDVVELRGDDFNWRSVRSNEHGFVLTRTGDDFFAGVRVSEDGRTWVEPELPDNDFAVGDGGTVVVEVADPFDDTPTSRIRRIGPGGTIEALDPMPPLDTLLTPTAAGDVVIAVGRPQGSASDQQQTDAELAEIAEALAGGDISEDDVEELAEQFASTIPDVVVQWTDDGGATWSTLAAPADLGFPRTISATTSTLVLVAEDGTVFTIDRVDARN